jgi:hypothetical protein
MDRRNFLKAIGTALAAAVGGRAVLVAPDRPAESSPVDQAYKYAAEAANATHLLPDELKAELIGQVSRETRMMQLARSRQRGEVVGWIQMNPDRTYPTSMVVGRISDHRLALIWPGRLVDELHIAPHVLGPEYEPADQVATFRISTMFLGGQIDQGELMVQWAMPTTVQMAMPWKRPTHLAWLRPPGYRWLADGDQFRPGEALTLTL